MDYTYWREYFKSNRTHFSGIDFQAGDELSDKERNMIFSSVQQFQKGENSEGKHLYRYARTFPDAVYLDAIRLFICEEQMHARVLGKYMDKYSIPRIQGHWVDSVFRQLRKLAGIENTITVLLIAEIISKVYYDGLHNATRSHLLRKICSQILKDEDQHIAFQCYTLRFFYARKSAFGKFLFRAFQTVLMNGTIAVVWIYHGKVIRKGGYSLNRFWKAVLQVLADCELEIIGKKQLIPDPEILFP